MQDGHLCLAPTNTAAASFEAGYSLPVVKAMGFTLTEAVVAGYSVSLRDAHASGFPLAQVRDAGYSLSDAVAAGYPYSLVAAKEACYPLAQVREGGHTYSLAEAD
eukprot:2279939-Prymnesium_polylepis.1